MYLLNIGLTAWTYSGKPDHYKYLLECVHELLHKLNILSAQAATEMGITPEQLDAFILEGQPRNDQEKHQMVSWVRRQAASRGINLKILEMDDVDTFAFAAQQTAANGTGGGSASGSGGGTAGLLGHHSQQNTAGIMGALAAAQDNGASALSGLSSMLSGLTGGMGTGGISGLNPGSINNLIHNNSGNGYADRKGDVHNTNANTTAVAGRNGNNVGGADVVSMRKILPPPDILASCIANFTPSMLTKPAQGSNSQAALGKGTGGRCDELNGILSDLKAEYPVMSAAVGVGQHGLGSSSSMSSTSTIGTVSTGIQPRGISPSTSDDQKERYVGSCGL